MAKDFLTSIDLNGHEIQNVSLEKLASAPGSPFEGQIYYNTTDNEANYWDGTSWITLVAGGGGATNLTYTASTRTVASDTGTDAVITEVVAAGDSGLITGADKTKLDGVEALADVTDAVNVVAALDAATITDAGTPAATDQILIKDAGTGVLQTADFSEFGGGGGSGTDNVINTDGEAGEIVFVGTVDPTVAETVTNGDVWISGQRTYVRVAGDWVAVAVAASGYETEVLEDAPLFYLPLDEESGGTALDSSGNARNGSHVGTMTYVADGPGAGLPRSVETNGTSSHVLLPALTGLVDLNDPQSWEFWFYTPSEITTASSSLTVVGSDTNEYTILYTGNTTSYLSNERLATATGAADRFGYNTANVATGWHHYVITYSGTNNGWSLYLDGAVQSKAVAGTRQGFPDTKDYYIGRQQSSYFITRVAGIAVYDTELTATRVLAHYDAVNTVVQGAADTFLTDVNNLADVESAPTSRANLGVYTGATTPGLYDTSPVDDDIWISADVTYLRVNDVWVPAQAHYSTYTNEVLRDGPLYYLPLNEESGTVAEDASGNGLNGTYDGTVTFSSDGPGVGLPRSIETPSTSFVELPDWTGLSDNGEAQSWEFWFYTSTDIVTGSSSIVYVGDSGTVEYTLMATGSWTGYISGERITMASGSAARSSERWNDILAGWHHFVATFDGNDNGEKMFLDGQPLTLAKNNTAQSYAARTFKIGYGSNDVQVAGMAMYDYELDVDRIRAHYNAVNVADGDTNAVMFAENNLSDVISLSTARSNLGVYSTAETDNAIQRGPAGPTYPATLTYASDKLDGIMAWLGSQGNYRPFFNPATSSPRGAALVTATQSTTNVGAASNALSGGNTSDSDTTNVASSWWKVDFGANLRVNINKLTILGRATGGAHPRNWKVQQSTDDTAWTDLVAVTSAGPSAGTFYTATCTGASAARYIRILNTGVDSDSTNYLALGEVEMWGTISQTIAVDPGPVWAQITDYTAAVLADTPLCYYKLDESSGSTANDSSGNSRHGTYETTTNMRRRLPGPSSLAYGLQYATEFDGRSSGSRMKLPLLTGLGSTQAQSWDGWFYIPREITTDSVLLGPIVGSTHSDYKPIMLGRLSTSVADELIGGFMSASSRYGGQGHAGTTETAISPGWHHFAYTFTGTANGYKIYVDAVALNMVFAASAVGFPTTEQMMIGDDAGNGNCKIRASGFAVYGSTLSAARVLAHFEAGGGATMLNRY